jgi:hypothetical protein
MSKVAKIVENVWRFLAAAKNLEEKSHGEQKIGISGPNWRLFVKGRQLLNGTDS